MSGPEMFGLGLVVAAAFAAVDFCAIKYVYAVTAGRRHGAARWSVAQWAASAVGFVLVIKVSLWLMLAEAGGLYIGSWYAGKSPKEPDV